MAVRQPTSRGPTEHDATAIGKIDAQGLATGHATFRETPHDWPSFRSSFLTEHGVAIVAEDETGVIGWAGISPTSSRAVYRGVGEVSIYVAQSRRHVGVGRFLLEDLISASEDAGYWTLLAQIFPENTGSLSLHDAVGFQRVGVRRRLGQMTYGQMVGCWRDVVLLERRSEVVGC